MYIIWILTYTFVIHTLDNPRLILSDHTHLAQVGQSGKSLLHRRACHPQSLDQSQCEISSNGPPNQPGSGTNMPLLLHSTTNSHPAFCILYPSILCSMTYLSSLPTMQVETRRQHESGHGMEENWAHHRLTTILREERHKLKGLSSHY